MKRVLRFTGTIITFALALGSTARGEAATASDATPSRILIITTDTTRADHLSGYGYARATSPTLDRLATAGVRVETAISTMPTTDPAHLSLFTGLHPRTHGVLENGVPLPDPSLPNLATWAKQRGYRTAAFVSRAHVQPSALALAGFDFEDGPTEHQRDGAETLERALAWLADHGDAPYFLWVHFFDPHTPYLPPTDLADRFMPESAVQPEPGERHGREHVPALIARYDGEILYMDGLIARLLARVHEDTTDQDPPLVVVVGDHGEAMDELIERHSFAFDHGKYLYQGIVRVPLIFAWGDHLAAGSVAPGPMSLVDVSPTLFALLGEPGFANQGESFATQLTEPGAAHPVARASIVTERRRVKARKAAHLGSPTQYAIQDARWKLILSLPGGAPELYDLAADPGETRNLAATEPEQLSRMRESFDHWLATTPASGTTGVIPDEKLEALRALGYLD